MTKRQTLTFILSAGFLVLILLGASNPARSSWAADRLPNSTARTPRQAQVLSPQFALAPKPVTMPRVMLTQPQLDANTVALYRFDTQNGNKVVDATGNYAGTLFGNASVVNPGLYGGALWLDGRDGPGSYVRTSIAESLDSGTIEAFVDFYSSCVTASEYWPIFSAGREFGSYQQPKFWLGADPYLKFKVFANNKLYIADTTINPCRYLNGSDQGQNFSNFGLPVLWPYETWRFHHIAATWGPRGIELWVDGVLHAVGYYVPDPSSPPDPNPLGYSCSPQQQEQSRWYPYCEVPQPGLVPGAYGGGLPSNTTFLIGCDPNTTCFKGRIDEVQISKVQRTFDTAIIPPSTPTPSPTPNSMTGEYSVDSYTLALYHLNSMQPLPWHTVEDATNPQNRQSVWLGNPALVSGRFNNALALDGNGSYVLTGPVGNPPNGTVEVWVRFDNMVGPFGLVNVGAPMGSVGTGPFLLGVQPQHYTLRFGISDGTNWHWAESGWMPLAGDSCWHHIAGTWGAQGLAIWIDGNMRGSDPYTGRIGGDYDPYIFGCDAQGRCVRGTMDEVRVSSVQRTFSTRTLAAARSSVRAPSEPGILTFLPWISVAPTPSIVCPFGN